MSAQDALTHPYLDEGRLRYHSCMCQCCHTTAAGRQYTTDFEPTCTTPFSYSFEDDLTSLSRVKGQPPVYRTSLSLTRHFKSKSCNRL